VLALTFGRTSGAAYGIVQSTELTLCAGIHIAHATDYDVGLIVEIEAISNELLDVDFGRSLAAPITRTSTAGTTTPLASAITTLASIATVTGPWATTSVLVWRPILAAAFLCLLLFYFCHCQIPFK
jgi:hypothetical protein